jgi:hypothetical protein
MREMKSRRILFALLFVLSVVIVSGGCGGFNEGPGTRYEFADLLNNWVVDSGSGTAVRYLDSGETVRYTLNAVPQSGSITISEVSSEGANANSAIVTGNISFSIRITSEDGQTVERLRDEDFTGTFVRQDLNKFRMVGTATGSGPLPQITITINSLLPNSAVIEESGTTLPVDGGINIVNATYRVK